MTPGPATARRHRPSGGPSIVLPAPPDDLEKHSYAERNLGYLLTILVIGASCLSISQLRFELQDPALWPFLLFTGSYVAYQALTLPVNFTGADFDLTAHNARAAAWRPARYPALDILLPVCGEPLEVLRNTWTAVASLVAAYPGVALPYVLDDGESADVEAMATAEFGFGYLCRPDRPAGKKAGNLRHAFARTGGEFVVIFDADFAPRDDFLAETLPYLDDPAVAIVQTPQFFRGSRQQSWIENAAGAVQEVFYRTIQVARNRFDAAICVGTSAVYRRAALEPFGGPTLIPYAEDVHTGLDVRRAGWSLVYLPVVLSAGICPADLDAFVRQQYRWCSGNVGIVFSRRLWSIPMSVPARLTYISGFAYYAYTALLVFFGPAIPIAMLAFLPGDVQLRNFIILAPSMVTGLVLYPYWHRARYGPATWSIGVARGWAHVLAIWDGLRGTSMSWQPTRTAGSSLVRFRIGVTAWSGGAAAAWVGLATWRTLATGSLRFTVLLVFGVINLAVVARVVLARGDRG